LIGEVKVKKEEKIHDSHKRNHKGSNSSKAQDGKIHNEKVIAKKIENKINKNIDKIINHECYDDGCYDGVETLIATEKNSKSKKNKDKLKELEKNKDLK